MELIEEAHRTADWSQVEKRAEEQYVREDALILARKRYEVRLQACNEAGSVMMINTGGQKLRKRFTRHDYKSAKCVRL